MEWNDEGIVLNLSLLGENKRILTLLTLHHGKRSGLVGSRKGLDAGQEVQAFWKARLEHQLGYYRIEKQSPLPYHIFNDAFLLTALMTACALCYQALPDHHPYPVLYESLRKMGQDLSPQIYIHFETLLLKELGYGLDLQSCAVCGTQENLTYVSPRTGRAACETHSRGYESKLLSLPLFFKQEKQMPLKKDLLEGLALTGYFLERYVFGEILHKWPKSRDTLIQLLKTQ